MSSGVARSLCVVVALAAAGCTSIDGPVLEEWQDPARAPQEELPPIVGGTYTIEPGQEIVGELQVMRTLIADASHQLRTPIAALRAQAELAAEETDPDRQLRIVGRIHERSKNLSRLTEKRRHRDNQQ